MGSATATTAPATTWNTAREILWLRCQLIWQSKAPEEPGRAEGGDLRDQRAAQGQHIERDRQVAPRARIQVISPERQLPVCACRNVTQAWGCLSGMSQDAAIASRPRYRVACGGIANVASSTSMARIASTSPVSNASVKQPTRSRIRASPKERRVAAAGPALIRR
jgi:hypothetical protein